MHLSTLRCLYCIHLYPSLFTPTDAMPASVYIPSPLETFKVEDEAQECTKSTIHSNVYAIRDGHDEAQDDSSLPTIDALMRRRARLYPDTHVVSYPSSGINFIDYTLQQLDVFAWRAAKVYERDLPVRLSSAQKPTVVALLGPSNLEYLITMLALTKLGHTVLLLSTRIPQIAVESLLEATGATTLIAEARHMQLATQVRDSMASVQVLELAERKVFEFSVDVRGDTRMNSHLDPEIEKNNIAWIIHSSGGYSHITFGSGR